MNENYSLENYTLDSGLNSKIGFLNFYSAALRFEFTVAGEFIWFLN